jgi:tRNA modification GTPase
MDTIFAQCSALGKAGVAVFRISGPASKLALQQLITATNIMQPGKMYLRRLHDPLTFEILDEAMVVLFNHGSSFTGEETVEIHTHGSLAVMKKMNAALASIKGLRLAEPGEFAKRAFLNGKMDLTSAEGLADLIDAETDLQHKQAIMQLGGGLLKLYDAWREQLLQVMGLIEAYIDFPDEDIPEESLDQINNIIGNLIATINLHLNDSRKGERLRNGLKLAIIGKPNAGKSSLLNYLMQREVAIVSNIAGTTRDVIEGHLDIGGYPIILQDTAGINDATLDEIEQEGIKRAKNIGTQADIKIIMFDSSVPNQDYSYFNEFIDDNTIILFNKIDLGNETATTSEAQQSKDAGVLKPEIATSLLAGAPRNDGNKIVTASEARQSHDAGALHNDIIPISVKEGQGLDLLLARIEHIAAGLAGKAEAPQITRARHRVQLEQARESLSAVSLDNDLVLAAEDLRMTIRSLSNITGKITVDEILGEIFSNFCIGK